VQAVQGPILDFSTYGNGNYYSNGGFDAWGLGGDQGYPCDPLFCECPMLAQQEQMLAQVSAEAEVEAEAEASSGDLSK